MTSGVPHCPAAPHSSEVPSGSPSPQRALFWRPVTHDPESMLTWVGRGVPYEPGVSITSEGPSCPPRSCASSRCVNTQVPALWSGLLANRHTHKSSDCLTGMSQRTGVLLKTETGVAAKWERGRHLHQFLCSHQSTCHPEGKLFSSPSPVIFIMPTNDKAKSHPHTPT